MLDLKCRRVGNEEYVIMDNQERRNGPEIHVGPKNGIEAGLQ